MSGNSNPSKQKIMKNLVTAVDCLISAQNYFTHTKLSNWRGIVGSVIGIIGVLLDVLDKEQN